MTHSKNCILKSQCKKADSSECNRICGAYIAMHGLSGSSGRIGAANIPADYRRITVENSTVRANQAQAYKLLDSYVATFSRQFNASDERIKSAYLWSESPGTGKTTTACGLLNTYLITHYVGCVKTGQQPLQRPVYFCDVNEMQTIYNEFNRSKVPEHIAAPAAEKYYTALKLAQETPFVVLDDIGVRTPTEGFRADLHSIINARVTNKFPTVYTSNLPISELSPLFGEQRLADRIKDQCVEISFTGSSKRGMRK